MDDNTREVMERIQKRRIELGMSYGDLAKKTGINKATLQRYESGSISSLPTGRLIDIAKALFVSPQYLLTGKESEGETTFREKYGLNGDIEQMVEAMHKSPKLMVLFSRTAKMDEEGIEAVLKIVELMRKEE
ncbi:MAG: helix-turn-helix domain-containing protein [Christensenellales bacterium]